MTASLEGMYSLANLLVRKVVFVIYKQVRLMAAAQPPHTNWVFSELLYQYILASILILKQYS